MSARPLEVLFCGTAHVVYARFQMGGSRPRLEAWQKGAFQADPTQPVAYATAVATAFAALPGRPAKCAPVVVCGPLPVLTKVVDVPKVAADRQEGAIRDEVSRAIPHKLEEVVWDHAVMADDGIEQRVLLVAARKELPEALCTALATKGAVVRQIAVAPALLANACSAAAHVDSASSLLVDAGQNSTSLVFLGENEFSLRTVAFGHASAGDAGEAYQRRLAGEITRSLAAQRRQADGVDVKRIFLTGSSLVDAPGFATEFPSRLSLPAEILRLSDAVDIGGGLDAESAARDLDAFAPVGAVALSQSGDALVEIDLLPHSLRTQAERRSRFPLYAAAAGLVFVAGSVFLAGALANRAAWADGLQALRAAVAPVRALDGELRMSLAEREALAASIRGIEGLVGGRDNWIRFFADLQDRLTDVENVWIDSMEVVRVASEPAEDPRAFRDPWDETPATPVVEATMRVRGRMLDQANPLSRASADTTANVTRLIDSIGRSEFVRSVGERRFDASQPGILQFEFTLQLDPGQPL